MKSRKQLEDRLPWLQETEFVSVNRRLTTRRTKRSMDLQGRLHKLLQVILFSNNYNSEIALSKFWLMVICKYIGDFKTCIKFKKEMAKESMPYHY